MATTQNRSARPDEHAHGAELIATEVDDFNLGLPRMSAELRRSDGGAEPTSLLIRSYEGFLVGHIQMGFSKVGHVDTDSDVVTIVAARVAAPGTKWDGVGVEPGGAALYPGGGRHQAADQAGLEAAFVVVDEDALLEAMDDLGRRPRSLAQGRLRRDDAAAFLHAYERGAFTREATEILETAARIVSTPSAVLTVPGGRRLSSERIVRDAIDHAVATENWMPASLVLCRASGVSERRLQEAFREVYDRTPSEFFRIRALSEARSRLLNASSKPSPVTTVALDLGFRHLGRFASGFRRQFGEYPSELVRGRRRRDRNGGPP